VTGAGQLISQKTNWEGKIRSIAGIKKDSPATRKKKGGKPVWNLKKRGEAFQER